LDLSKAFGSGDLAILLEKLNKLFAIRSTALSLIKSYFTIAVEYTVVNG